jgi:hypothetical protein
MVRIDGMGAGVWDGVKLVDEAGSQFGSLRISAEPMIVCMAERARLQATCQTTKENPFLHNHKT